MRTLLTLSTLLLLASSAFAQQQFIGEPATKRRAGNSPEIGEVRTARIGEPLYAEFNALEQLAAELRENAIVTRSGFSVPESTVLLGTLGGILKKHLQFCIPELSEAGNGITKGDHFLCLRDLNEDGKFETILERGYRKPEGAISISYNMTTTALGRSTGGWRKELVYQGVGGNVLKLQYREFQDDMARPAFTQDLNYTFQDSDPTEIGFKDFRAEVISAGNEGLKFRVLSGGL